MDVLVIVLGGPLHVGLARTSVRQGWSVLSLNTSVEAVREIRDRVPRLVVVQVSLASDEPIRLIRMLRLCAQPVLVVAVANTHRNQLERTVRDAGAACYLPSSEEDGRLADTVASLLGYSPAHMATGTTSEVVTRLDPPTHLTRPGPRGTRR